MLQRRLSRFEIDCMTRRQTRVMLQRRLSQFEIFSTRTDHFQVSGRNIRKRPLQFIPMAQNTASQTAPQLELIVLAIRVKKIIFR